MGDGKRASIKDEYSFNPEGILCHIRFNNPAILGVLLPRNRFLQKARHISNQKYQLTLGFIP